MKNFLSQTWVTSALVIVAILLIAIPMFKDPTEKKSEGDDAGKGGQE